MNKFVFDDKLNYLIQKIRRDKSHVGMIIHSTTLDTMEKVIEEYGGTTWICHSGYVLRGAESGVVSNNAVKTGGSDDSVIPYHTHTFTGTAVTSGNQSANHTHSIPAMTGTAVSAGAHTHDIYYKKVAASGTATQSNATASNNGGSWQSSSNGAHTHTVNIPANTYNTGNNSTNHTHSVTAAGTNSYVGTDGNTVNANIPNYKSVYIWERTA